MFVIESAKQLQITSQHKKLTIKNLQFITSDNCKKNSRVILDVVH